MVAVNAATINRKRASILRSQRGCRSRYSKARPEDAIGFVQRPSAAASDAAILCRATQDAPGRAGRSALPYSPLFSRYGPMFLHILRWKANRAEVALFNTWSTTGSRAPNPGRRGERHLSSGRRCEDIRRHSQPELDDEAGFPARGVRSLPAVAGSVQPIAFLGGSGFELFLPLRDRVETLFQDTP